MRAAVVGCGTAGAAAGIFLARAGHVVEVFERVAEPAAVGAGIVLQPTGLRVLEQLGCLERILARGARLERLRCVTRGGRVVVELPYAQLGDALFGAGIHRGALFEALVEALGQAGAALRCGVEVERLERPGDRPTLRDAGGGEHGPYDLVVIADGARSPLRAQVAPVRRQRSYPWGALWFIADEREGASAAELFQVVDGPGRFLGLLPTGLGPGAAPGPGKVSLFWSVRADRVEAVHRAGLEAFRDEVRRLSPRADPVLAQLTHLDQLLFARYHDVVLARYHGGRVVCLGDAAHAMSPQLGQGANLALWDAMVLAEELARGPAVEAALERYTRRRRRHVRFYQRMSRWLTPFFQSDHRGLGALRDALMPLACRLPLLRAQMVRTMCGVKRGLVRRSLPLVPPRAALPAPATRPDEAA